MNERPNTTDSAMRSFAQFPAYFAIVLPVDTVLGEIER
jgi:hypothetical protein